MSDPVTPEVIDQIDLDEYRLASFQHAEAHDAAGTDPESCDDDDCPHWPLWWVRLGQQQAGWLA